MTPEEKRAYNQAYYQANKERLKQATKDYRIAHPDCRKGEKARYRERYGAEKFNAESLAYYYAHKAERAAYLLANRERILAGLRASHAKYRESRNQASTEYRLIHREVLNRKTREKARATGHASWKEWCRRNRAAYLAIATKKHNKRRALKVAAAIGTDRKAYLAFVASMKSRPRVPCYWCGKVTTPARRHVDHIVALARGGPDAVHNLCCSCPRCNTSKQAKTPEEFNGQMLLDLG